MRAFVVGKDRRRFAVVITVVGALLLLASVFRGAVLIIGIARGIIVIATPRDLNINVMNVIFNFVIPLAGGSLLIMAGNTLMRIHDETVKKMATRRSAEAVRSERTSVINRVLNSDERGMLELITSRDFVLQSDLMALTGYSKVKVHRMLKKLETKGLVRKSRFGITNRVFADRGG